MKSHLATLILKPASRKHSKTSRRRTMWSSTVSVAMTMSSIMPSPSCLSDSQFCVALKLLLFGRWRRRCTCQRAYVATRTVPVRRQRRLFDGWPFGREFARKPKLSRCWCGFWLCTAWQGSHQCEAMDMRL